MKMPVVALLVFAHDETLLGQAYAIEDTRAFAYNPFASSVYMRLKTEVPKIARIVLKNVNRNEPTLIRSEELPQYHIHVLSNDQYGFVIVAHGDHTPSFAVCMTVDAYTDETAHALLHRMNAIDGIKRELADVKQLMLQNIDKVIEQSASLEELIAKTDHLNDASIKFKKDSERLNRWCCWLL